MKTIATVLSCAALLSCSTESDGSRSPLLDEVVRAPGVVWSTETLDCRRISSEDIRLDALSKANEIERHRLVRARNIQLIQWVLPYYGWVATARAGVLDDQVKNVDRVIQDAGDRRLELKQYALAENCIGRTAEAADTPAVVSTIATSTAAPDRHDVPPAAKHVGSAPRAAKHTAAAPTPSPAERAPAVGTGTLVGPTATAGMRVEGSSATLPLDSNADVDRAAAAITSALQQR